MAINEELTRIKNAKEAIKTSIEAKGVTVGDGTIDTYASKINEIPSGVDINEYYDLTKKTSGDIRQYIKSIPLIDTSGYTSMRDMFAFCESLTSIPQLDTSKVTNMYCMLQQCKSLTIIPELDTSNVTNMGIMFGDCYSLTSIPQLNTSKVTNMYYMFGYCTSLTSIPQLDTSNVTDMHYMFSGCTSLTTIPELDTSNVTNMYSMFSSCYSLTSIPQLNTSKVTNMYYMFDYCTSLTTLGGFKNLGQSYDTTASANYQNYRLDLSYSENLTHDSLMNVINNLYDIATKGCNPQKLELGSTNIEKLTADEIAIATNKGWTVI